MSIKIFCLVRFSGEGAGKIKTWNENVFKIEIFAFILIGSWTHKWHKNSLIARRSWNYSSCNDSIKKSLIFIISSHCRTGASVHNVHLSNENINGNHLEITMLLPMSCFPSSWVSSSSHSWNFYPFFKSRLFSFPCLLAWSLCLLQKRH